MSLTQTPMRRFSNLLYRRPNLYLAMLLIPPLIWFGAIYLGSLLTLLWQGFYTFDDFTMAVTPDLTLANFAALFQPSNFDIILRTLSMAIAVSIASAALAFPIAYYMARYTSGKTKAFFYIAVMMPMWASYIVKAYAWTLLLAKGGDFTALKIREIANEHKVMVLESPALARAVFYSTELDEEIPAGLYLAIAQVLAYVYQLRQYQAGRGKRPAPLNNLPIPPDLRRDD